jgi:ribosomal protein S17
MVATTLTELVSDPYAKKKYLVILKPYKISTASELTLYYSGEGFVTEPTDSPANTLFESRLVEPISFSRSMFSSGKLGGFSVPGFGEILMTNTDGGLDAFADYAWDGRSVEVRVGQAGAAFEYYFTIFNGQAKTVEFDDLFIRVIIRDNQNNFEVDFPNVLYAGSGGTEGADSIANQPKPLCFGEVFNIEPVLVDAANNVYQVHNGQIEEIVTVYEGGHTLSGGQYSVDLTNGRFTLNSASSYVVTADVKGAKPSGSYKQTVADIARHIVTIYGGLSDPSDLNTTSFSALNTANSSAVGIYVEKTTTVINVLDDLFNTIGAFYGFDRDGLFEVGQISLATGDPDFEFDKTNIIEITRLASEVPNYQVRVNYKKNYRTFSESEFHGSVSDAQREYLLRDSNVAIATDSAILTPYPNSNALIIPGLFAASATATTEASRLLTIYKTQRDFYKILVKTQPYTLKLNDVVKITFNRYNLSSGKLFRVISIVEDAANNEVELELWG